MSDFYHKFYPVSRDRLFYDQCEYGICVSLAESSVLRAKTQNELVRAIGYRNQTRNSYSWSQKDQIQGEVLENLLAMFNELDQVRDRIKLIVGYNIMYIYSNDMDVLQKLSGLQYVNFCSAVRAVLDRPRDVILKTNPKFKYRSYFKEKVLEEYERDRLVNFLESRQDIFGFTKTLKNSLNRYRVHLLQRHLYIEHNDPKDITMLSLVMPGIIRKTFTVQAK